MMENIKSGLTPQNSCKSEDNIEHKCSNSFYIPEQLFCTEDDRKNRYVCTLYYGTTPLSDKCTKLTLNIQYFERDDEDDEPSVDITSIFAHVVSIGRKKYVFSLFCEKLDNMYSSHLRKDNYTCCLIQLDKDGFCSELCDFRLWHDDTFVFLGIQECQEYEHRKEDEEEHELEKQAVDLLEELQKEGVELPVAGIGNIFKKVCKGVLKTIEYVTPGGQVQLAKDIVKLIIDKTKK